ncbi:MAG: NAD-dependent epimerase/dehydratase family protein, partial [Halieaceae bacterium]|nr:NAD-dependent epimerase/dehydratase family protein [Halieaceae bacterium]
AAIGTDGKGTPSTEETPFASWHFASEYIMSKYISHLEVKGMVKGGLPVTMVMPGLPFGPGDRMPTPTGTMIIGALKGQMKNYWDGGVCPVDVRDVAAGHILAMAKGRIGESYILGNAQNNMSNREFLQRVGKIAGVDNVAAKEISRKTMLRVARLAELFSKITGKAPITTVKNSAFTMEHFYIDASKAVKELGLPQTPIDIAIQDAVEWFRSNGYA